MGTWEGLVSAVWSIGPLSASPRTLWLHTKWVHRQRQSLLCRGHQAKPGSFHHCSTRSHHLVFLCFDKNTKRLKKMWQCRWKSSEREKLLCTINNSTPSKKYLQLISCLDHWQASLLFQLHSGHIGLNHHLFHVCKSKSPACSKCQGITVETIRHFLLNCPHYRQKWHALQRKLCQNAVSLSFLLSSPVVVLPLLKFVHATGRFKMFFGKDVNDKIRSNAQHNRELWQAVDKLELAIKKAVSDKHLPKIMHKGSCTHQSKHHP